MHPHLHTKDNVGCEEIMTALDECHAKGFLWKMVGGCTKIKHEVNMCLRAERLERTRENREKAIVKREKGGHGVLSLKDNFTHDARAWRVDGYHDVAASLLKC